MTTFDTIDGQIMDQIDSFGNVTEYMHDALGSVTGTTDGSGNLQNTYRWAPYGTRIVKTGTAADPAFQWVGTLGYRATGRAHGEYYVRARQYGTEQAGWCRVDALWTGELSYGYARVNPTLFVDRTGNAPTACRSMVNFGPTSDCGGAWVCWLLCVTDNYTGWIVQQITNTIFNKCCGAPGYTALTGCGLSQITSGGSSGTYYEAFYVQNGKVLVPDPAGTVNEGGVTWGEPSSNGTCLGGNDEWTFDPTVIGGMGGSCTSGSATKRGQIAILGSGVALPAGFRSGNPSCDQCAGSLPCATTYSFPGEGEAWATLDNNWSCCLPLKGQPQGQFCTECASSDSTGCMVPASVGVTFLANCSCSKT